MLQLLRTGRRFLQTKELEARRTLPMCSCYAADAVRRDSHSKAAAGEALAVSQRMHARAMQRAQQRAAAAGGGKVAVGGVRGGVAGLGYDTSYPMLGVDSLVEETVLSDGYASSSSSCYDTAGSDIETAGLPPRSERRRPHPPAPAADPASAAATVSASTTATATATAPSHAPAPAGAPAPTPTLPPPASDESAAGAAAGSEVKTEAASSAPQPSAAVEAASAAPEAPAAAAAAPKRAAMASDWKRYRRRVEWKSRWLDLRVQELQRQSAHYAQVEAALVARAANANTSISTAAAAAAPAPIIPTSTVPHRRRRRRGEDSVAAAEGAEAAERPRRQLAVEAGGVAATDLARHPVLGSLCKPPISKPPVRRRKRTTTATAVAAAAEEEPARKVARDRLVLIQQVSANGGSSVREENRGRLKNLPEWSLRRWVGSSWVLLTPPRFSTPS